MVQILVLWRMSAFVIFTALMFSLLLLSRLLLLIAPTAWRRTRNRIFCFWAKVIALLMGMKVAVSGPPPQAPFLLIANHVSYMDIVLLAHYVNAVFVAKAEVSHWPFLGPIVRSVNTIFVDRRYRRDLVRANHAISKALSSGLQPVCFGCRLRQVEVLQNAAVRLLVSAHFWLSPWSPPSTVPDPLHRFSRYTPRTRAFAW